MSILENMIYGFISGLAEFLPVSSQAHQVLLRYMFGVDTRNFLQEFLVHIGLLLAVFVGCRDTIARLRREQKTISGSRREKSRSLDLTSYYDIKLIKTATFPLIIGLSLSFITDKIGYRILSVMAFLIVNAFVLLLADHSQHGNRDSRTMTGLDGFVMGILGSMSVFPGISRTGMISSYAILRGADSKNVTNWAFLLGIPAILFFICFDLIGIFSVGIGVLSISVFFGYILTGIFSFLGGYVAISVFQVILNHSGLSQFAYYSIGMSMFSFILYLIT